MYDGYAFVRIDTGECIVCVIRIVRHKHDWLSLENVHDGILKIERFLMLSTIQYIKFDILIHVL